MIRDVEKGKITLHRRSRPLGVYCFSLMVLKAEGTTVRRFHGLILSIRLGLRFYGTWLYLENKNNNFNILEKTRKPRKFDNPFFATSAKVIFLARMWKIKANPHLALKTRPKVKFYNTNTVRINDDSFN